MTYADRIPNRDRPKHTGTRELAGGKVTRSSDTEPGLIISTHRVFRTAYEAETARIEERTQDYLNMALKGIGGLIAAVALVALVGWL